MIKSTTIYNRDGLVLHTSESSSGVTLIWSGLHDSRDPGLHLDPGLEQFVSTFKSKSLTIDFSGLEYMNSAAVSPIISFIRNLDAAQIPTSLVYNTSISWQRVTARCMRIIARTLNHIQVVSPGSDS
jgi:hypothetical protein